MFFHAVNLTTPAVSRGELEPWEFKPTETITPQIRASKEDRQNWYQNAATRHDFYTGIEAINSSQRVSKENIPHAVHAFVADYDIRIPMERVNEAIEAMAIKPSWVEKSLGGNFRLVWTLSRPIYLDDYLFCSFVLTEAMKWLALDTLPGLDEKAFVAPSRLYCNGCEWRNTGHGDIPEIKLQSFFVRCGKEFRFKTTDLDNIPLDVVEAALRKQYSTFDWPAEFSAESQGPTFWLPDSTSPLSAIVKLGGMFTFSAHASKSFYTWSDLLGTDYTKKFAEESIARATADIWWDGKRFWKRKEGQYISIGEKEMLNFLRVDCKLPAKANSDGIAPTDTALSHIYNHGRVVAAVPFVMRPSGLVIFQGKRKLNTYSGRATPPAPGKQTWGNYGLFPFISLVLDAFFTPSEQLPHWLAWLKYYYTAAFNQTPLPGQNIFLMGGVGIGKTLLNRDIVGTAVGGYVDAAGFLVDGGQFNSHLIEVPHWCLDDDTPSNNPQAQTRLHAMFKKVAANQQWLCNTKFEVSGMTEWMGRIGATTNLDFVSSRIVGPLDNAALDKTSLFRCPAFASIVFPSRLEIAKTLPAELPSFLRWLLDWTPPDFVETDSRYGYKAYHDSVLLDQTHQSGSSAPFKETLFETLTQWFEENKEKEKWSGTVSQLVRLLMVNPMNDHLLRHLKLDQSNRYLEQIQREGLLKCDTDSGPLKTRLWTFYRPTVV